MRTTTVRLALITALISVTSSIAAAGQSATPAPFDVVKVSHPELQRMVGEAYLRSVTFHVLVEKIRTSGWLVFVQAGPCPERAALGCLIDFVGTFEGSRYVRAIVNFKGRHPDEVMATIGHELQHAVEVAQAPGVLDAGDFRALFQTIGQPRARWYSGTTYDTAEARRVEAQVRCELSARPKGERRQE